MSNDDTPDTDYKLNQESLSQVVDRALSSLSERERDILKMFFGIGCSERTLEEIGTEFGLTRERVRQIKEKALRKLKAQNNPLLKTYLGD